MPIFAQRLQSVAESSTLKLNALVQSMKAEGQDIVNLSAGEPDGPPPQAAFDGVLEALRKQEFKYTPIAGILQLREAISAKHTREQPALQAMSGAWKPENVVLSNGAKQAIFNSLLVLLNPGDEVLIPSPYWSSYPEMVRIVGGVPKPILTSFEDGFRLEAEKIRAALTPRVKLLILNSPSNPTGRVLSRKELEKIAQVLKEDAGKDVWILSDEIYELIDLGGTPFCSFLEAAPELRNRTITVNGLSKSASLTGWRVGWSIAARAVTKEILKVQGQSTSGINCLAQRAALSVLETHLGSGDEYFNSQNKKYQRRLKLALDLLRSTQAGRRLQIFEPSGAFYLFLGMEAYLGEKEDSVSLAQKILTQAGLALVPGDGFGHSDFLRLSFACEDSTLRDGLNRFLRFLSSFS